MEEHRAGNLTHEEVDAQLEELGVTLPERGGKGRHGGNILEGLDDETQAEAKALMEEAEKELSKLGVNKVPFH
jgi:hypothetical protein